MSGVDLGTGLEEQSRLTSACLEVEEREALDGTRIVLGAKADEELVALVLENGDGQAEDAHVDDERIAHVIYDERQLGRHGRVLKKERLAIVRHKRLPALHLVAAAAQ